MGSGCSTKSLIMAWALVLWMGCGSESTGSTTATTGGAGASPAAGGASGAAGMDGGGSNAGGGAAIAGAGGTANPAGCPTQPPSGACTKAEQSLVCKYVTTEGCPLTQTCGYLESASPIWYSTVLPFLTGPCPKVGATCPYSVLNFNQVLYAEFQCSADMTWQQHLCPATAPSTGDPCSMVKPGSTALLCFYDERCTGGMLERTVARCSNCATADAGCTFAVGKGERAGACFN